MKRPVRILLVDDHRMVRDGLAAIISTEPDLESVGVADSGEEAIVMYRKLKPDVILMDLRLPGMSGADATAQIRKIDPQARVIILTAHDGDEDIYRSLQAGARGYVLKAMLRHDLLNAIRVVASGQRYIPAEVAARLAERLPCAELTRREGEILALLVDGLSNRQVSQTLGISEGSVRIHVSNILSKLGVADRTQAVTAALRRGLVQLRP